MFRNRAEAGRLLAKKLAATSNLPDRLILALARGGVPVGFEIAKAISVPLDVFVVRKLGVPGQEELAMGAIASGGVRVLYDEVVQGLGISGSEIERIAAQEQQELERRERLYRHDSPALDVRGRTVILVDDGLATGTTMRAAITALRKQFPARLIVAVPVAPPSTVQELKQEVEDVVCLLMPESFSAISQWYEEFPQTSDEEIRELLERAARERATAPKG
ncbi:MAG: phosphoribosyltransferase [Acidobacteria bacterium]|nr:phosphoribosyltransferase [Acidobacteriota bacterium]